MPTPTTYPSRGPWKFTNLDRAFDFWPRLESINVTQEHPEMLANFDCEVVDVPQSLVFAVEDHIEVLFSGEAIWRGHLNVVGDEQSDEGGPRIWALAGRDYTAKLDDGLIKRRKKRKKERLNRRIRWILSYMRPAIWSFNSIDLSGLPDGNPFVEPYEYYGNTVREALNHVADELRLHFYVDLDNNFRMFRNEDVHRAPFDLDNEAPDWATTFPFREWSYDQDSTDLSNAILVEPKARKNSRWTKDSTSIAAYGRHERFLSDDNLHKPTQALAMGNRTILSAKDPEIVASCVVHEPGIIAGHRIHVREALWDHDEEFIVRSVNISALDAHDAAGNAFLKSEITLTDRLYPRRHKGGGGTPADGANKVIRGRPGSAADTDPHPLDLFNRVVSPPTISTGTTIVAGAITKMGTAQVGRSHAEVPVDFGFAFVSGTHSTPPGSYLGSWYSGWTSRPTWTHCAGLDNSFQGYKQHERWYKFTIPAHPTDPAGIKLTLATGAAGGAPGPGYGEVGSLEFVVLPNQPTDIRQGTVFGELKANSSGSFVIPYASVPASGSDLWIGVRTKWECNKEDIYNYVCGWSWPQWSHSWVKDAYGQPYGGYSGTIQIASVTAAVWQVWDSSAVDFGTTDTPPDAPWVGGNAVQDDGNEGSPTWSMDGKDFVVASEVASGKGLVVVGEREDEDALYGPWSDSLWAVRMPFTIDAVGDVAAAGQRHIELVTTGDGERAIGRVQLGDGDYPMGIYVAGPNEQAFLAKTITAGAKWQAKFDTRAEVLRGKLWLSSDGEPANWDVEVALAETEDELDRYSLWVRVGNGAGFSQEARVHGLYGYESAGVGHRVVKEFIGFADGLTKNFKTAHRYRKGTLRGYVNGHAVGPDTQDPEGAAFTLDFWPTARSIIRVSYIAD